MIQPNRPRPESWRMCSNVLTPPEAMIGTDTAVTNSRNASRFGPASMPSRLISV